MSLAVSTLSFTDPIQHAERLFPCEDGNYVLPHDEVERERLLRQHDMMKVLFGGRIILPPVSFTAGENILDCGTGAGAWLMGASAIVPQSVQLYGIDIGSRLWPKRIPDNVHLSVKSVTDLPQEWENTFSFVHQRLLICALRLLEWQAACKEMYRVTTPGGWVQLTEIEPWCSTSFGGGPCAQRVIAMIRSLFSATGLVMEIIEDLPSYLRKAGFTDISREEVGAPCGACHGRAGVEGLYDTISVMSAMKTSILNLGGLGHVSSEKEFDMMMIDLEEELRKSPEAALVFVTIYARKPEA